MKIIKRTGLLTGMLLFFGLLFFSGSIEGVSAYFTDTDSSANTFTVGKVTIEHHEDKWDDLPEDEKKEITPNKEFDKDPAIENTGDNAAYVFQTVQVPCKNVIVANLDGTRKPQQLTDLFSYSINGGWTLMTTEDVKTGEQVTAHKYTYVYGTNSHCTPLEAGATTPTLFDKVRFANVIEEQGIEDTVQDIMINAYAIQTGGLGERSTDVPGDVLGIIYKQAQN